MESRRRTTRPPWSRNRGTRAHHCPGTTPPQAQVWAPSWSIRLKVLTASGTVDPSVRTRHGALLAKPIGKVTVVGGNAEPHGYSSARHLTAELATRRRNTGGQLLRA